MLFVICCLLLVLSVGFSRTTVSTAEDLQASEMLFVVGYLLFVVCYLLLFGVSAFD